MKTHLVIPLAAAVALGLALVLLPSLAVPSESSELKLIQKLVIAEPFLAAEKTSEAAQRVTGLPESVPSEVPVPAEQSVVAPGSALPEETAAPLATRAVPSNETALEASSQASEIAQQAPIAPPAVAPDQTQEESETVEQARIPQQPLLASLQNLFIIIAVGLALALAVFFTTKKRSEI